MVNLSDREVSPALIEACRAGEQDAFRALYDRYKDRVYSIALYFFHGDHSAAADVTQEVFLKLMTNIRQFRGDSEFSTWLYRLVVNSCLDYRRREKRLLPMVEDFFASFRAPQESALGDLLRDEMQQQVQEVVAKLAPEHRVVIVLRYTEGLSYEEIAELLQCSRGTVASRLNRAHKVLERRLATLAKQR